MKKTQANLGARHGTRLGTRLGKVLKKKKKTIATAESCTGGLLASRITDIDGSSAYFIGSITAYSNKIKNRFLNVREHAIKKHGAVSEVVACAMAKGIRKQFRTDIGLSTTGIAGPSGGTPLKPVGTVWIGYSDAKKTFAQKHIFKKSRTKNKQCFAEAALKMAIKAAS